MGYRKYKPQKNASAGISNIIVALCADYDRRKTAICEKSVSKRVRMEYLYINTRMFEAAAETVGFGAAETFIQEIGSGTGYAGTKIEYMAESTYKVMKGRIKNNMAKKLYLCD